ncbi:MAG: hypothetical protein BWX47_01066 [candidate division Hyd24-12 bacterium ADurb.Bin004]|nr:MAG: hypothetical protein BWX47_01066 [candidate division Hyd24-12 bacterium ADurb.Bin004]
MYSPSTFSMIRSGIITWLLSGEKSEPGYGFSSRILSTASCISLGVVLSALASVGYCFSGSRSKNSSTSLYSRLSRDVPAWSI